MIIISLPSHMVMSVVEVVSCVLCSYAKCSAEKSMKAEILILSVLKGVEVFPAMIV